MKDPWIYVVLLGAVIAVFGLLRPHKEEHTASFQKNMEDTLEQYVEEVAAENEQLLQVIEKMKQEQDARHDAARRRMDKLEAGIHLMDEKLEAIQLMKPSPSNAVVERERITDETQPYSTPSQQTVEEEEALVSQQRQSAVLSIRDRYPELFDLLDQGVQPADAAVQLQLPLGEIQLIMQLALQEDHRV
ncbi:hypothetical protein [Paenibacillus marinisediminis]